MADVTISIISTNEREMLRDCLNSIRDGVFSNLNYEVFVVDNFSNDGTSQMLEKDFREMNVIRNDRMKSFCENHNMVIDKSNGKYIFVLNADVFLLKGHVERLVKVLDSDPTAGAVMGKLISGSKSENKNIIDSTGVIIYRNRRTMDRGQGQKDIGQFDEESEIFSPSGAAMLCRRKMLEDIKLFGEYFDTTFYAYKEELDLCWRARLRGWKFFYVPDAVAYHARGWGKGTKRAQVPRSIRRESFKNRYLMMLKNDHLANFLKDLPYILWHEFKALLYVIFREPHLFIAWFRILALLPLTLRKRAVIMKKARVGAREIRKWFV